MFTARECDAGADIGKWYAVVLDRKLARRVGYCALECSGHASEKEALAHHLQYHLDRKADLWLERRGLSQRCEICGDRTSLRARLGCDTKLFVLCQEHQSTNSLKTLFEQRHALQSPPRAS